jgi:hypothetical protein
MVVDSEGQVLVEVVELEAAAVQLEQVLTQVGQALTAVMAVALLVLLLRVKGLVAAEVAHPVMATMRLLQMVVTAVMA